MKKIQFSFRISLFIWWSPSAFADEFLTVPSRSLRCSHPPAGWSTTAPAGARCSAAGRRRTLHPRSPAGTLPRKCPAWWKSRGLVVLHKNMYPLNVIFKWWLVPTFDVIQPYHGISVPETKFTFWHQENFRGSTLIRTIPIRCIELNFDCVTPRSVRLFPIPITSRHAYISLDTVSKVNMVENQMSKYPARKEFSPESLDGEGVDVGGDDAFVMFVHLARGREPRGGQVQEVHLHIGGGAVDNKQSHVVSHDQSGSSLNSRGLHGPDFQPHFQPTTWTWIQIHTTQN